MRPEPITPTARTEPPLHRTESRPHEGAGPRVTAVEALYFQTESLESAHAALEIERRFNQELFEGGPDGYLVTDPGEVILRASGLAGALFAASEDGLIRELLHALRAPDDRGSLERVPRRFETGDRQNE